jgi:tagatose 1,6-diphosphate aldolase GatY/KbaY
MLESTKKLLAHAQAEGYAIGAYNVYNLEEARGVVAGAETERSPAILQVHPPALAFGGKGLLALCLEVARSAQVPIAVQLDHSTRLSEIELALNAGLSAVMADGSQREYAENVSFSSAAVTRAHRFGASVEAELGRLTGQEDRVQVADYEGRLTDPDQAATFVAATKVDALAVCIGNVHGPYLQEPQLDFERLEAIRKRVSVPLVLHGASGLPVEQIQRCITLGVVKFNLNTELRAAYLEGLRMSLQLNGVDLLDVMLAASAAVGSVVAEKQRLFGASNRAP